MGHNQNSNPELADAHLDPKSDSRVSGSAPPPAAVTFIRSLESQGAAAAISLEEEPHLMVGADNEIWDRRTCQAVRTARFREVPPTLAPHRMTRSPALSGEFGPHSV